MSAPSPHRLSPFRVLAARAFEFSVRLTGMPATELSANLGEQLYRDGPVSRQTLAAWRRGEQGVPFDAYLAACATAGVNARTVLALAEEGPAALV